VLPNLLKLGQAGRSAEGSHLFQGEGPIFLKGRVGLLQELLGLLKGLLGLFEELLKLFRGLLGLLQELLGFLKGLLGLFEELLKLFRGLLGRFGGLYLEANNVLKEGELSPMGLQLGEGDIVFDEEEAYVSVLQYIEGFLPSGRRINGGGYPCGAVDGDFGQNPRIARSGLNGAAFAVLEAEGAQAHGEGLDLFAEFLPGDGLPGFAFGIEIGGLLRGGLDAVGEEFRNAVKL